MKLSEKIVEFASKEELLNAIVSDKSNSRLLDKRYPVRFIFIHNFQTLKDVASELKSLGVKELSIEDYLPQEDGWIDNDTLFRKITETQGDILVVPFSEIARFYSKEDFQNFFTRLMTYQNKQLSDRRIYLPLIGLYERFEKDFFELFTRNSECAPLWSLRGDTPQPIMVYLMKNIPPKGCSHLKKIKTSKEWFCFWKRYAPSDMICSSKPILFYSEHIAPETIFTFVKVENAKDLIKQIYKIEIPIEYLQSEEQFWNLLISYINKEFTTYNQFLLHHCNVKKLDVETIVKVWITREDEFTKWLLRHYLLSQNNLSNTYIDKVFSNLEDYSNQTLFKHLYTDIFSLEEKSAYLSERNGLIQVIAQDRNLSTKEVEDLFYSTIHTYHISQILPLCTGAFLFEKKYLLQTLAERKITPQDIATIFPDLFYYLTPSRVATLTREQAWVNSYMESYKKSKLQNICSEEVKESIYEKNANETTFFNWYYTFSTTKSHLSELKVDKLYWIDGLGIEWISFIENYIENRRAKNNIEAIRIGRAELPTTTEYNRYDDAYEKVKENPDKYAHEKHYQYPETIIEQFELIKKIIDDIITDLSPNERVAIVSDHGLTALSRLVEPKRYGKDDGHAGRYIQIENESYSEDSDYIKFQSNLDGKSYLIALSHPSLGTKPSWEVHGGCTPEEVLVPVMVLSHKQETKQNKEKEYTIHLLTPEIQSRNPILEFTISDNPVIAFVEINSKRMQLEFDAEKNKWTINLDKPTAGKNHVKVIIANKEYPFEIHIKAGMEEEDLFS